MLKDKDSDNYCFFAEADLQAEAVAQRQRFGVRSKLRQVQIQRSVQVQGITARELQVERLREPRVFRLRQLLEEPLPRRPLGRIRGIRGRRLRRRRREAIPTVGLILAPGFTARVLGITKEFTRAEAVREARRLTRGVGVAAIPIIKQTKGGIQ